MSLMLILIRFHQKLQEKNKWKVIIIKSQVMDIITSGELVILKFKELCGLNYVNHTVSTRFGGVSTQKDLASLNLGSQTSDSPENILENYRRFCEAAGYDMQKIVLAKQTHSTNVRYVDETDYGKGVLRERDYNNIDALITDKPGICLAIHTADCVPVSFTDTRLRVIGNAHCGWRGTYGRLAEKTVNAMKERFGTDASDLVCTVGPCICAECYEVSEDLFADFENKFSKSEALKMKNGKYYIDLALINKQILIECGVKKENIIISDVCTCCNTDYMFSHRGQGAGRGIIASCLSIV